MPFADERKEQVEQVDVADDVDVEGFQEVLFKTDGILASTM